MTEQALEFFRRYIAEEEDVFALFLLPTAPAEYNVAQRAFLPRFFEPGFVTAPGMGTAAPDADLVELEREKVRSSHTRAVFQIKHYRHKTLGEYVRVYVSNRLRPGSYDACWLLRAQPSGELRVFSTYGICGHCGTLGAKDGAKCSYCGGRGWLLPEGEKVTSWGTLTTVRKLVRPVNVRHAEEYDRE